MELKPFLGVMITISAIFASVTGSAQSNKKDKGLQYGKPSEGFRLAVQPKTTQVRVHEDALLQLSIKNVTKNVLLLGETSPEHDYYIDIRNSRGDAAKLTPFGQSLYHGLRKDYRNTTIKVQPGQELKAEIDIGKQFDLSVPGTYHITATRKIFKLKGGRIDLVSNTTSLDVVP